MKQVKLLVHEVIREDAHVLFGFLEERERSMFRALIGVSGVGANTARVILSSIPVAELEQVIVSGDYQRLKNVKGIGLKTAQRVIVDLKDKIKAGDDSLIIQPVQTSDAYEEALAALLMLGFARQQSQKVLKKIFDANYGEVNTYHKEVWEQVYPEYDKTSSFNALEILRHICFGLRAM